MSDFEPHRHIPDECPAADLDQARETILRLLNEREECRQSYIDLAMARASTSSPATRPPMTKWDAIGDFLESQGYPEWAEDVRKLTGKVYVQIGRDDNVAGVFSSEKAARRHDPTGYIQEFIVDDLLEWENGPVYTATIRMSDGEIHDIYQEGDRADRHPTRCLIVEQSTDRDWGRIVARSPISTAHAMQAAMDRRDQIRGVAP